MEYTIDRSSYRRSNRIRGEIEEKRKETRKNVTMKSILLNEIIVTMSILIGILCVKMLDLKSSEDWINKNVNAGISFDVVANNTIAYYEKLHHYVSQLLTMEEDNSTTGVKIEDIQEQTTSYLEESTVVSGEEETRMNEIPKSFETAVEGVNQLSDDAKMVRENYDIIRPILGGTITSKFGARVDSNPVVSSYHTGLDIAANTGTTIVASHDGIVTNAGWMNGYRKLYYDK